MVGAGESIGPAHDHVGLLQRGVCVSTLQMRGARDVARTLVGGRIGGCRSAVNRGIVVVRRFGLVEDERRLAVHRRRRIDDRRLFLVVDLDQRGRVSRRGLGFRHDRDHGLTHVEDVVDGKGEVRAGAVEPREVAAGDDVDNSR